MAGVIKISSNAAEVIRRYRALPPKVQAGVERGLRGALLQIESKVRMNASLKWRRGAAGLSGRLASVVRRGGMLGIKGEIGFRKTSRFPYELAQEFGARARPGGAMTIPLTAEAKAAESARQMQSLFVYRARSGKAFLAEAIQGKRFTRLIMHFLLVKDIPPRLKFRETVLANVRLISDGIVDGARQGVRGKS